MDSILSLLKVAGPELQIPREEFISRSFTKQAAVPVEECAKWYKEWEGLSNFNFNIEEAYQLRAGGRGGDRDLEMIRAQFVNVIYHIFSAREAGTAPLREFRLLFHNADHQRRCRQVREWMRWAARLGCEKMDVSFLDEYWFMTHSRNWPLPNPGDEPLRFNFCFSDVNNSRVADVCLRSCSFVSVGASNLDSIENISLYKMELVTGEEISQLISRCRKLRQFTLDGVSFHDSEILNIRSDTLESLTLRSRNRCEEETITLSIEAQALLSLRLIGFDMDSYAVDAPNLVDADVEFLDLSSPKTCENLDLIIENLFGVARLRFHNHDHQGRPLLQVYKNLTQLELITKFNKTSILGLQEFLRASPRLETLVLDHTATGDSDCTKFWDEEGYDVIAFNTPSLKTVIIKNYMKTENEAYTVELLKEGAEVLECILGYPPQEAAAIILWGPAPIIH